MSATGMLKEVTLINPAHGISPIKQEGQFNIIQISGSFMMYDNKGTCSGGMSITLVDSDGRSVEGSVGGSLIAATPVQVCIGSFTIGQQTITPQAVKGPTAPEKT
nr:AT-hook motif nuclear-localized protein 7-like [Malus domestica]